MFRVEKVTNFLPHTARRIQMGLMVGTVDTKYTPILHSGWRSSLLTGRGLYIGRRRRNDRLYGSLIAGWLDAGLWDVIQERAGK